MQNETLMTPEGRQRLQDELDLLVNEKRAELAKRIKEARELGDLKENAEYHAAKNDQSFLETRIQTIEEQLRTARVIDADESHDRATVGSTVEVVDTDTSEVDTYVITGVSEADPLEGRISYESPIGAALMGAEVGHEVRVELPRGVLTLRVQAIRSSS